MKETLLSVGIDIGTSTTQLIFSRLTLVNRANPFSVPQVSIDTREVLYRSAIYFTPLCSDTVIDAQGIREIVAREYGQAGRAREEIDTGAVIITGETARKENAQEVLSALSDFAGDFVVATAGPDLESILAARGAGVDEYSREHHADILHIDIGGGTSNLALYRSGELAATGCLDVGGRLIKVKEGRITYVSPVLRRVLGNRCPQVGGQADPKALAPALAVMVEALEQAAGLRPGRDQLEAFLTPGTRWTASPVNRVSFSGGVADCIYQAVDNPFAYGDLGVLLGRAIRESPAFGAVPLHRGSETIRATVVGAGSHSTQVSGSTIYHRQVPFPLKNIPILKLTLTEEGGDSDTLAAAITDKLGWFADEGGLTQLALGLRGERNPSYARVQELADGIAHGLAPLQERSLYPIVVSEADMAKVLGQALSTRVTGPLLCLDGVGVDNGDYIDIGTPVVQGTVLPVVIKTLVFNKK